MTDLRKASTTMNMTLLKGASGLLSRSVVLNLFVPGINGLYGKKPVANTNSAAGSRTLERTKSHVAILVGLWLYIILQLPLSVTQEKYSRSSERVYETVDAECRPIQRQ